MRKTELSELILNGENSGVEFKRDDVHTDSLATEIVALLNLKGGHIFLGIEDNGEVTGLTRHAKIAEEWLMSICRDRVQPPVIPFWETVQWDDSTMVGVITLPADSPDKPYNSMIKFLDLDIFEGLRGSRICLQDSGFRLCSSFIVS